MKRTEAATILWEETPLGPRDRWPTQLLAAASIVESSSHPMYVAWGDDLIIIPNRAYLLLLGESGAERYGKPLRQVHQDWTGSEELFDQVLSGKPIWAENMPFRLRRGGSLETAYFTFSYTPLFCDDGRVRGLLAALAETSHTYRQQEKLTVERDALHSLLEQAPGMMALFEGPDHRFAFSNAANRALLNRNDVVGKTVVEAFPEIEGSELIAMLDRVYATGEPYVARMQPFQAAGGKRAFIDFVYRAVRSRTGEIVGVFAEGHDVTAHHDAKEQIIALQTELIHISRLSAMGSMAATLAHELNQPLSAIANYIAGTLRVARKGGTLAQVVQALQAIGDNAHRAGEIIRSLRKMTERGAVTRQVFNPEQVIRDAAQFALIGDHRTASIEFLFGDDVCVFADPVQIQQVIINLVKNACEAGKSNGAEDIEIALSAEAGNAKICVNDQGPGIPPNILPTLFDSFFSTKAEGMGIGLSISRTIIEAHGGSIWAENRPEGGAAFCFTLPLADGE